MALPPIPNQVLHFDLAFLCPKRSKFRVRKQLPVDLSQEDLSMELQCNVMKVITAFTDD
jgi:hypothetical protein